MIKKLAEEECIKIGGHCWKMEDIILPSNPPQYIRVCIHCGKKQTGQPKELGLVMYDWKD